MDSYWKAGNTAVSTKETRNQWSIKKRQRYVRISETNGLKSLQTNLSVLY